MDTSLNVRIVPMNGDHLDEVAELERVCFSTPWSRNMLSEELENDCSAMLVALDGEGHVAGYAGVQVILDEGYITNVAVPAGVPAPGRGGQAAAGVFGLCQGPPAGVFDPGSARLQRPRHGSLRGPWVPGRGPAEKLLRASPGGCSDHDKGV